MTLFNQLLNENIELTGNARFTYEPNDKVEIFVDFEESEIRVEYFRTSNHLMDAYKSEYFPCLTGSYGQQSTEEKFNEIIEGL